MALGYHVACAGLVPIPQDQGKGGGSDQAGTTAKDTFYLMTVALEQLAFQFICLLFCG